jgi:formate dehydrogenase iron-sulfur subunit
MKMSKAVLIDLTKCIGCRACQAACKQWNDLPTETTTNWGSYENPPRLSSKTWTKVTFDETTQEGTFVWIFAKRQCAHCEQPACVSACPVGGLQKTSEGPVAHDITRCIGCRNCHDACPFDVPGFTWEDPIRSSNLMSKCTFCTDRQAEGMEPACAKVCPTEATIVGERDELLQEAENRIAAYPNIYADHIYGEHEVGGTAVLYLSAVPFDQIGFPTLGSEPIVCHPETETAWSMLPFSWGIAAVASGFYWIVNRRNQYMAVMQTDTKETE